MPPSSLYCCHRSVSRISAAARNRRIAASPSVSEPFALTAADPARASKPPAPVAATPTATPCATNARRLLVRRPLSGVSVGISELLPLGCACPASEYAANPESVSTRAPRRLGSVGHGLRRLRHQKPRELIREADDHDLNAVFALLEARSRAAFGVSELQREHLET